MKVNDESGSVTVAPEKGLTVEPFITDPVHVSVAPPDVGLMLVEPPAWIDASIETELFCATLLTSSVVPEAELAPTQATIAIADTATVIEVLRFFIIYSSTRLVWADWGTDEVLSTRRVGQSQEFLSGIPV